MGIMQETSPGDERRASRRYRNTPVPRVTGSGADADLRAIAMRPVHREARNGPGRPRDGLQGGLGPSRSIFRRGAFRFPAVRNPWAKWSPIWAFYPDFRL